MARSTLEQWRMFKAVVEYGGFAQAAEATHKSQSSINHAVHKLQNQLNLKLLEVVGRKAQLTEEGELMLRRAQQLLVDAQQLETIAASLARGDEAELRIAVDEIYPKEPLAMSLAALARDFPHTRVELRETVLSGGPELLTRGEVDLLVAGSVPTGFLGEPLLDVEFIAVSHPEHALQTRGRELHLQDLTAERQIVVRDSGLGDRKDSGWLGAEQRWTVSHVSTSIEMISLGLGFAWLPKTRIAQAFAQGRLKALPLARGGRRKATLLLAFADPDRAGPATRKLAEYLRDMATF
ncbi:MAG: LysR family transcriptional regulator [Pseudomonadota bacterium]